MSLLKGGEITQSNYINYVGDSREAFETNRKTIDQVEKLIDQMIEVAFNDEYEKQQKKRVAV